MPKFVKCKNCGEAMPVDITSEVLHCEHCGKKYKNPYFKPQEILEEVAPQAPVEEPIAKEEPMPVESAMSFEIPSTPAEEAHEEPSRIVRAPKKGVAIARLIFALIAFGIACGMQIVPSIINYIPYLLDGGGSEVFYPAIINLAILVVLFVFLLVNFITSATCVSGKESKIKSNRSGAIASAIFSLLVTLWYGYSAVNVALSYLNMEGSIPTGSMIMTVCLYVIPNFIVFVLSCVCATQLKKAIKNPSEYSVEVKKPAPVRNTPKAPGEPIGYVPEQNQAQQTGYIPVYGATPSMRVPGAKSEFNGGLGSLIGLNIVNFFIVVFTLGFGVPWAIRREYTWLYEHQIIDGRKLEFTGKAGSLLGQWVKWIFLSIITLGIYAWLVPIKKMQWITENTHIEGVQRDENNNQSKFDGKFWSYLGESIINACIITFTFGICTPWAICRKQRWELEHQRFDGQRLVFDGSAGSLLGQWIKWCLLSIITLGIYALWVPIKKQKWITEHTHFEA